MKWAPSFGDDEVCEVPGTREEVDTDEGMTCTVQLQCAYGIRRDVMADIIGGRVYWPLLTGLTKPPFAVSGSAKGFEQKTTSTGQTLDYEMATLTINYESKGKDPEDLISESLEPTCEFITLSPAGFSWTDVNGDPLSEEEAPGKQFRGLNLNRTIYKWEPPLPAGLLTNAGKVNDTLYTSSLLGLSFPAETLLFIPPTMDRTITSDGEDAFNVSLKFAYKPDGWNKFWRTKTQSFEAIYSHELAAEYKNYPLGDFSAFLY